MPEMNTDAIKGILLDYKKNISESTWKNKMKVIFDLKSKFGDGFNSYTAELIYDKIEKRENDETNSN